jgi:DNA-dependent RNA polymerase auxiliary subunit epsilon
MDEIFINTFCKKSLETLDSVRTFFAKYHPNSPVREKIQAMYIGLTDIKNQTFEPKEVENWYILYESLCISNASLKNKLKESQAENSKLRIENKECWERFHSNNDLVNKMIKKLA